MRFSSDSVPSKRIIVDKHHPVLLKEAIESLDIHENDTVVDATLGGAGHARAITHLLGDTATFIGFDLDRDAIGRAKDALEHAKPKTVLIESNFRAINEELTSRGIISIDKALFDLGWSAYQLDAGRGFSFLANEPLLMTYRKDGSLLTAADIVNTWEEESIADVLYGWGDERYSRRIAHAIVSRRKEKPFKTSGELADVIRESVPFIYRKGKIHPATKTFQALRIAVNDELGAVREGLAGAWKLLSSGGRIAVITFHSIEDRVVKELFLELQKEGTALRITKSPIKPSSEEIALHPRSRSAKLRVIQKI